MSHPIKLTLFALLLAGLLVACAAPATATPAPTSAPATAQPEPTQPPPTATSAPSILGEQVVISVDNETFNATVTGNGDVAIILGYWVNDASKWVPLVEALSSNNNLQIVTFAYRDVEATLAEDTVAVFDHLRAEGINRMICMVSGFGQTCGALQNEPEIAGMVFLSSDYIPALKADFPKLFLTTTSDAFPPMGVVQREYDQAAEPKEFKSYESGRTGLGIFTDPKVGSQVLADITDFINGIVNGQ